MYESLIRECLARAGRLGKYDPRHVEAWMRLEHPTLNGLAPEAFASEVLWATRCIDRDGVTRSELLAGSLGLAPAGRAA
jgi:hypothetical protein